MITAKIIADSIANNVRLTTMELNYPRFIHSEFMTHRMFSRNASSSRAIPVEKMLEQVQENPAMPIHWGKNQSGMQAREELTEKDLSEATERVHEYITSLSQEEQWKHDYPNWWYAYTESFEYYDDETNSFCSKKPSTVKKVLIDEWERFAYEAGNNANELSLLGLHKQVVNRLIEPFLYIKVIVTATEWENFFKLRLHEDAQPEIQELAKCMKEVMDTSIPVKLEHGEWHLPYVDIAKFNLDLSANGRKKTSIDYSTAIKCSVARCARVSYLNHDSSAPDVEKDIALADRLLKDGHMSPLEHQLSPMKVPKDDYTFEKGVTHIDRYGWKWSGNMRGWYQHRHII